MSYPYDPRRHVPQQDQSYQPGTYAAAPMQPVPQVDPRGLPNPYAANPSYPNHQHPQTQWMNTNGRHNEELFVPQQSDPTQSYPAAGSAPPPPPPPPRLVPYSPYTSSPYQRSPASSQTSYSPQQRIPQSGSYNPQLYGPSSPGFALTHTSAVGSPMPPCPAAFSPNTNGSPSSAHSTGPYRSVGGYSPFQPPSGTPISQHSNSPYTGNQFIPQGDPRSSMLYRSDTEPALAAPSLLPTQPGIHGLSIHSIGSPPPPPPVHSSSGHRSSSYITGVEANGPLTMSPVRSDLQSSQSVRVNQSLPTHSPLSSLSRPFVSHTTTAYAPHVAPTTAASGQYHHTRPPGPQTSLSDGALGHRASSNQYPVTVEEDYPVDKDQIWREIEAAVLADPVARPSNHGVARISSQDYGGVCQADDRYSGSKPTDRRGSRTIPLPKRSGMVSQEAPPNQLSHDRGEPGPLNYSGSWRSDWANTQNSPAAISDDTKPYRSQPNLPEDVHDGGEDTSYTGVGADMGFYGGGYAGRLTYGKGIVPLHGQPPAPGASDIPVEDELDLLEDKYMHPFPDIVASAPPYSGLSVHAQDHTRRLSFEQGDEAYLERLNDMRRGQQEPDLDGDETDIPDLAFYPPAIDSGPKARRPLPALPPGDNSAIKRDRSSYNPIGSEAGGVPLDPDGFAVQSHLDVNQVPRAASLLSHGNQPFADLPMRAKTDADEKKPPGRRQLESRKVSESNFNVADVDLPVLPASRRRRFTVQKLTMTDFSRCREPWALSAVAAWLKEVTAGESELKEKDTFDTLVALFIHKVITMNIADAEVLARQVLDELLKSGYLMKEEEWVRYGDGHPSSVIIQLAGLGCYSSLLHERSCKTRCYSYGCARTVKKVDLTTHSVKAARGVQDWASFWNLQKGDLEGKTKKEIERQNVLHEIIQTESEYIDELQVIRTLYRDGLRDSRPAVMKQSRLQQFEQVVFGGVEDIERVNTEYLLAHLKYRQQEKGPWVPGYSDLFREWVRRAKDVYIAYSSNFPAASTRIREEAGRNVLFNQFLENARNDPRSRKLGWDSFFKAPITRLQRYGLLLGTVLKNTEEGSRERENLMLAISEIKEVTHKCDAMVAERKKQVDMEELSMKLMLRPGMEAEIQLELRQAGRELIKRGDLQRLGGTKLTWLDIHAMLFDHYFIIAKRIVERTIPGGPKIERYDVSKKPISMDLLVVEGLDDDPVTRSAVRGLGTTAVSARPGLGTNESNHGRTGSLVGSTNSPGLYSVNSNPSVSTLSTISTVSSARPIVTNLAADAAREDKLLYPFRIRHLGQEVYTLFAQSHSSRQEWGEALLLAKSKHASALFTAHAEPFRLKILADAAFAYDTLVTHPVSRAAITPGTPLERSIKDIEGVFGEQPRPHPICRQTVNCAATFIQPDGQSIHAVGTDFGVYFTESSNPRGWYKAIAATRVTQLMVLEEFSLILVLADRALVAHHLDTVCQTSPAAASSALKRQAAQQISDHRDVAFFAVGRMKDRTLVFYKRRSAQNSVFKVLEPVLDRAGDKQKNRWGTRLRGSTEFFREYGGGFYIPTECYGVSLFTSSIAVSTARGFEMLTLDSTEKPPSSVPDLSNPNVLTIAARLSHQKPVSMLRLSKQEFLLVYETCAVYIDKHGDISRQLVIEFEGKTKSACLWPPNLGGAAMAPANHGDNLKASPKYLILFDADFVEVRDAENGRLRQVIPGRDVRMLDDGRGKGENGAGLGPGGQPLQNGHGPGETPASRGIKFALAHPERDGSVLILEMVLDEIGKY